MSDQPIKNLPASVRQRLLNFARDHDEQFQLVLGRYAMERLLYRLDQSVHRDRFVLKGAMLFLVWDGVPHRVTRDLDLLGFGAQSVEEMEQVMRAICSTGVADDGVVFRPETVRGTLIREDQEYEGVRLTLNAYLGTARIPLQIDVGFGDAVTPAPVRERFPTLLDFPAPHPRVYPRETVIAEKFHAMVSLGMGNSRMKDFFDVWFLARTFPFDGESLAVAFRRTFDRRRADIPTTPPLALTDGFAMDPSKGQQWGAFLQRTGLETTAPSLADVIADLVPFLMPPARAAAGGDSFLLHWSGAGPWASPPSIPHRNSG